MGGIRKKKGLSGEAMKYVTRNKACKMLQLGLPEFRKLCITKGVYPREPKSRKKAQHGDSNIKTLYLKSDIVYLSHEPIIWKIRDEKIYRREVTTLRSKKFSKEAKFKQTLQKPIFKVDHIVLERYPTFDKALQDLDDALSATFLYAALPNLPGIDSTAVHLCRKLTTEFLNYVIESRSLTKTFISIRGYFYRAHIMGEKVTWMIPHPFPIQGSMDVEMRIMRNFIDFYCTFLGFVNYKLFCSLNLFYPPQLAEKVEREEHTSKQETAINVIQSLNTKLQSNHIEDERDEEYDEKLMTGKLTKRMKLAQQERDKIKKQQNLFNGIKFYLGRETNRESLTLVIRSAGGLVSWDESMGPGFTYPEDDNTIRYQIVDRPEKEKEQLSRYYVQPQWVYDSFNNAVLLPVQNYFVGVELPAHLSPFEEAYHKLYNPPEMERLKALQNKIDIIGDKTIEELKQDIELEQLEDDDDDDQNGNTEMELRERMPVFEAVDEDDPLAKMKVKEGKQQRVNAAHVQRLKEIEDFRLAASFIHRKQKRMFKKVLIKEKRAKKYSSDLRKRRIIYEEDLQKKRKVQMKEIAVAAAINAASKASKNKRSRKNTQKS